MLESVKIQRRQSEIRQALAGLVGKEKPSDDETRSMETLDAEYRTNETRYRAALIAEDTERRDAGRDLETRDGTQWDALIRGYEVRQALLALDEGAVLSGPTAEVVQEMRGRKGYRGVPIPWAALERRAGETVASGVVDPTRSMPITDRLFAASVAGAMGAQFINIDAGLVEWPVVTSTVAAAWAATETGAVGSPAAYTTTERTVDPSSTFGVQMKITRKALKQVGALEDAVRRDMLGAITQGLDAAAFLGTGASGQPAGVLIGSYGITSTAVNAAATWAAFRAAVVRFLTGNAASGPGDCRLLIRPEVYDKLDATVFDTGSGLTEWDRLLKNIARPVMSSNALAAPAGGPPTASTALLTTTVGGVAPFTVATWGGVDVIRDPFSDAASGGLRITGLVTADVTVLRPAQLEILTGVQD